MDYELTGKIRFSLKIFWQRFSQENKLHINFLSEPLFHVNCQNLVNKNELLQSTGAATGGVLKNLAMFLGKHLCWSLFLVNLRGSTPILKNICERLLLEVVSAWEYKLFPDFPDHP